MIVVEYSTDDYGKVMEYASCIEKKAKAIREILEEDTMNQRSHHRKYDDDDEGDEYYERYNIRGRKGMGRYA